MRTLVNCREWAINRLLDADEYWQMARQEIGRRVSKSKRREITELQSQIVKLRAEFTEVRARAVMAWTELELLQQTNAEQAAFDAIRRNYGPS